ncbi:carbohydrate-binding protein [Streptacidiphilus monticola]
MSSLWTHRGTPTAPRAGTSGPAHPTTPAGVTRVQEACGAGGRRRARRDRRGRLDGRLRPGRVHSRAEQQLVCRGALPDAAGQQPAEPDRRHGGHRPQGLPAGVRPRPQRRRVQPDLGRHQRGVLRHRGRRHDQLHPRGGWRRVRLHRRLRRHQARPDLRHPGRHRRRLPAGDRQVRAARHGLRPGGARVREHRRGGQRGRRRPDPAAQQPRPVHLDHHGRHHLGHRLVRPADAQPGQVGRFHAGQLLDHALRRRLQRRGLADLRAPAVQHYPDEHLRLDLGAGLRPRGHLDDERPQRQRRVLLPVRLPVRAGLRDQPRSGPLHQLVGQPRPPVHPAGQQRPDLRRLQQRAAGGLGLHQVQREVRRGHAAGEQQPDPSASATSASPSASASPTGGTGGSCSGVAAWSSTTAYNGGAVVSYNGHKWTAKWWTYGDIPGGAAGVWTDNGAC